MIVLNLSCDNEHLFEGWFASGAAFESQREGGLVSCPTCGSTTIERRPSAPYVNTRAAPQPSASAPAKQPAESQPDPNVVAMATALLRKLGQSSEDVGKRFADEARRIHHGDAENRSIKGQASRDEVHDLLDEGIMVMPLPAEDDVH